MKRSTIAVIALLALGLTFLVGSLVMNCSGAEQCRDHHGEFTGRECP